MVNHYNFLIPGPPTAWEEDTFDKTTLTLGHRVPLYQRFFPQGSAVLGGFLGMIDRQLDKRHARFDDHEAAAERLATKIKDIPEHTVFVMAATDPFCLESDQVDYMVNIISQIANKKIIWLSGDCSQYQKSVDNSVYFPFWLAIRENFQQPPANRTHRFSCLNRRPARHRDLVIDSLLQKNLLDPQQDVYSIRWQRNGQVFATHPDNWPNDHSIDHAAYHAYLNIVTETVPWERGIISEKTTKVFESETAGIMYNSPASFLVLKNLGFEIDYVEHATLDNILPVVNLIQQLQDREDCRAWYQQNIQQHRHNRQHFVSGAWADRFERWFSAELRNL